MLALARVFWTQVLGIFVHYENLSCHLDWSPNSNWSTTADHKPGGSTTASHNSDWSTTASHNSDWKKLPAIILMETQLLVTILTETQLPAIILTEAHLLVTILTETQLPAIILAAQLQSEVWLEHNFISSPVIGDDCFAILPVWEICWIVMLTLVIKPWWWCWCW